VFAVLSPVPPRHSIAAAWKNAEQQAARIPAELVIVGRIIFSPGPRNFSAGRWLNDASFLNP
jgi:hypothetical protein